MSADNENTPPKGPRFKVDLDVDAAKARAQEAMRKSEVIFSRAYGLLREPTKEWEQIKAEQTTIPNIMIGYVAPLAAIPPVAALIGSLIFGFGVSSVTNAVVGTVVAWLLGVGMVYLVGIVINSIADNFDSDRDELASQKVAAYSFTPFFLSTLALIWPPLLWVPILALGVMVFLIYRGLPVLMKTPADRATAYTTTIAVVALLTFIVQMAVAGCVGG